MAKVIQPLMSIEARGAVGGYVYNTWRGLSTVRSRVTPKNQYSAPRIALRARTASCTLHWQSASNTVRRNWLLYANQHLDPDWSGSPLRLSGYNWFIRVNVRRLLLGLAITDSIPQVQNTAILTKFFGTVSNAHINFFWEGAGSTYDEDLYLELWISGPHSPARNPTIKESHRLGSTLCNYGSYGWVAPAIGFYRAFARTIHANGTVSIWKPTTIQVTSLT